MRRQQVITLGLSQLMSWGALFYALIPLQHAHAFGASTSSGSLLITLAIVVSAIAAYPVGMLLDRAGGRDVLLVGSVAGVLVLLGLAFSPAAGRVPLFVALGVVHAMALYEPAFAVVTAHVSDPGARVTALRNVTLLGGLASLVFAPLTAVLVEAAGPRVTLVVLAAILAAGTVPSHLRTPRGPGALRGHAPGTDGPASTHGRARSSPRALAALTIAFSVASFVSTAVLFVLLVHLAQRGVSAVWGSVVLGSAGACQLVGRFLHPRLARAWSPVAIVVIALAGQSIGAIGLLLGTAGLPVFLLAFGGGGGLLTVARPMVVEHLFGVRGFGRSSAVIASAAVLARAAAPAVMAFSVLAFDSTFVLGALALLSSLAVPGLLLGLARGRVTDDAPSQNA